MLDTFIIGRLSHYGTVISFGCDLLASGIYNGIRTAHMRLKKNIPSSLYIAGELVFVNHQSQLRTCKKRGEEGHHANGCTSVWCFNCKTSGHRIEDWEEPEHCKICLDTDYNTCYCPYYIFSANVERSMPGTDSYAKAAKFSAEKQTPEKKEQKKVEKQKEKQKDQPKKDEKARNSDSKTPPS